MARMRGGRGPYVRAFRAKLVRAQHPRNIPAVRRAGLLADAAGAIGVAAEGRTQQSRDTSVSMTSEGRQILGLDDVGLAGKHLLGEDAVDFGVGVRSGI